MIISLFLPDCRESACGPPAGCLGRRSRLRPAKAVDRLVARRAQMDEEEEVDDPNAKPDFLDDDIAASYINDHHRKIGSTIVVFPIHEPVTAGFTDSIKQEWFLRDDPNFLEKWAEEIWEQEHRVAVTEPHHSLDPHDGDEDDGW